MNIEGITSSGNDTYGVFVGMLIREFAISILQTEILQTVVRIGQPECALAQIHMVVAPVQGSADNRSHRLI